MSENSYPTLDEAVAEFLSSLRSENTRATYGQGLRLFAEFAGGGQTRTGTLTDDVLMRFCLVLLERDYSLSTVGLYLAATRRFFQRLFALESLPPGFHLPRAEAKLREASREVDRHHYQPDLPDERIPLILVWYDELPLPDTEIPALRILRNRALVHTLYASAGRISEVLSLTRRDVRDGSRREILISGKGGKKRIILLTPEAQDAIRAYCRARGPDGHRHLFVSHGRNYGTPLTRSYAWKIVKDAVRALGLYEGISPHDFRHYRATQLLNAGAPLAVVQDLLGHEKADTTRGYARIAPDTLRQTFDALTKSAREEAAALAEREAGG